MGLNPAVHKTRCRLADGVARALLAAVVVGRSVELIAAALAVCAVGVLSTVGTVAAVSRQRVHLLVEVAAIRQTVAAARYSHPTTPRLKAKFNYTDPTRTRPDTDKVRARCRVRAKFHYTDPTGPARTFLRRNSVGSVRVRVVEFSYYKTSYDLSTQNIISFHYRIGFFS